MKDDGMRSWRRAAVVALGVIVVSVPLYVARESQRDVAESPAAETVASFVGREKCIDCHQGAYELWVGSDHDNAMDIANEQTVLGNFKDAELNHDGITSRFYRKGDSYFVFTEGTGGEMAEFEVLYTFGIEPLQQYLVSFPGGRLQALSVAWDAEENRWFDLYPESTFSPDDWLHWTRNGQNWNGMCAECHSTNLKKNYDAATSSFDTTWSEIDVSCEACHGPASLHLAWAEVDPAARPEIEAYGLVVNTAALDSRQQVDLRRPIFWTPTCLHCWPRASTTWTDRFSKKTMFGVRLCRARCIRAGFGAVIATMPIAWPCIRRATSCACNAIRQPRTMPTNTIFTRKPSRGSPAMVPCASNATCLSSLSW
jgi:hypothetical protein